MARASVCPRWGPRRALAAGLVIGALAIGGGAGTVTTTQMIDAAVARPATTPRRPCDEIGLARGAGASGMPAPPPGRIYEVWLERGTQAPQPTDVLFSVTHSGGGSVGVPGT